MYVYLNGSIVSEEDAKISVFEPRFRFLIMDSYTATVFLRV
jgi:hypothetical protein